MLRYTVQQVNVGARQKSVGWALAQHGFTPKDRCWARAHSRQVKEKMVDVSTNSKSVGLLPLWEKVPTGG